MAGGARDVGAEATPAASESGPGYSAGMRYPLPLAMLLLACTAADPPWWEAASPCPPGASLHGEALPAGTPITQPTADRTKVRGPSIYCATGPSARERQGRWTSWHGNGRMAADGEWRGTQAVWMVSWDEWGRETHRAEVGSDLTAVTWWHADGTKAVTGALKAGRRHGVWTEWRQDGTKVGEFLFTEGEVREVRVDTSPLLHSAPLTILAEGTPLLPRSTAVGSPERGISLRVTAQEISVEGIPVDADGFTDALAAAIERHGLVASKVEARGLVLGPPRLTIQADPNMPWSRLRALLATAKAAGLTRWQFITVHPDDPRWPPQNGWERLNASPVLFALDAGPKILEADAPSVQARIDGMETPAR